MKKNMIFKKHYVAALMGLMLTFTACEISDTNVNPNQATSTGVNNLLANAIVNLAYGVGGDISQYNSILMQQTAGVARQHAQVGRYNLDIVGLVWDRNLYPGAMNDLHLLIEKSTESGAYYHRGMAKVLMAVALGNVTSLWGDAPYTEAFQGVENLQPRFDTSQQLYDTIQSLLVSARADFAETVPNDPNLNRADFIYSGNLARWTQATYALSARYHNHRSKVDPQGSATAVLNALNQGTFTSNAHDMRLVFGSAPSNANPWHNHKTSSFNDTWMGETFINLLQSLNDPRLPFYATTASNGTYLGQVAGVGSTTRQVDGANVTVSDIGTAFRAMNAPFYFISYVEVKFLEAEARYRLGQYPEAATAMNEAIIASLNRVTGSADAAYVAAHASETGASIQDATGFQRLMTHKYVASFLEPEAFTDWRRTGVPALTAAQDNVNGNQIPRRWPYPTREVSNNSANTPVVTINTRLWWDTP